MKRGRERRADPGDPRADRRRARGAAGTPAPRRSSPTTWWSRRSCATRDGRALSDEHFVFFNQLASPDLSVQQLRAGARRRPEQIEVDLPTVPAEVERIVVVLYVNEGPAQRRTLGRLRVVRRPGARPARQQRAGPLREPGAGARRPRPRLALGELYRHGGGWKFKVSGRATRRASRGIAADYGVPI